MNLKFAELANASHTQAAPIKAKAATEARAKGKRKAREIERHTAKLKLNNTQTN